MAPSSKKTGPVSLIAEDTWNTLLTAGAIINDAMPHEIAHKMKPMYLAIKSIAEFKRSITPQCEHLWQYRTSMRFHCNEVVNTHLKHLPEDHWFHKVMYYYKRFNWTNILQSIHLVIEEYEVVPNLMSYVHAINLPFDEVTVITALDPDGMTKYYK
jgi:hypothetical protein